MDGSNEMLTIIGDRVIMDDDYARAMAHVLTHMIKGDPTLIIVDSKISMDSLRTIVWGVAENNLEAVDQEKVKALLDKGIELAYMDDLGTMSKLSAFKTLTSVRPKCPFFVSTRDALLVQDFQFLLDNWMIMLGIECS